MHAAAHPRCARLHEYPTAPQIQAPPAPHAPTGVIPAAAAPAVRAAQPGPPRGAHPRHQDLLPGPGVLQLHTLDHHPGLESEDLLPYPDSAHAVPLAAG